MNIQAMAPVPTTTTTVTPNDDAVGNTPKNFMCPNPECGKTFGTRAGLRYHQKNANKPGCGPVGGDTLAQAGPEGKEKDEDTPRKKRTSNEGGEFKCQIEGCDKSYTTKAGLRYHHQSHHGLPKLTKEDRELLKKKRRKEKRAAKLAESNGQAASLQHQQQAQQQQAQQAPPQQHQQQQPTPQQLAQMQQQQQQQHQQHQQHHQQQQQQNPHQAYAYSQVRQPANAAAMEYYAKAAASKAGEEAYNLSAFQPTGQEYSYGIHQSGYTQSGAQKQSTQYYPQSQPQTQAPQGNLSQLQQQLQQTLQQTPSYSTGNMADLSSSSLNKFSNYGQYYTQQQPAQMTSAPITSFLPNPTPANGHNPAVWTSQLQGNPQAYAQSNPASVAMRQQQQANPAPNVYGAPVPQWGSTNPSAYRK